jgi:ribose 1,5-bisphosphokinase
MNGQLFAVVGPSGVGKDTLLDAAIQECSNVKRVRRAVTRQSVVGEDIISVTPDEFALMCARGDFALSWDAHGLSYGILNEIDVMLSAGQSVVFNGSRTALDIAQRAYPGLKILSIEADYDVLRSRLIARGRETMDDIEQRLERAKISVPTGPNVVRIMNNGSLEYAIDKVILALTPQAKNVL